MNQTLGPLRQRTLFAKSLESDIDEDEDEDEENDFIDEIQKHHQTFKRNVPIYANSGESKES